MKAFISDTKKNIAYQSIYQILLIILPLVTAPYIARVLGAENVGIYSYTSSIANYFTVFSMLGIEQYGTRSIARVRDSQKRIGEVFSEIFSIHLYFSVFVFLVYAFLCFFFTQREQKMLIIQGIIVFSSIIDINWLFFGLEKFKITVVRNIIIKGISIISIFIFVRSPNDLELYALVISLGSFLSQVILWGNVSKYAKVRILAISKCRQHFKPLIVLSIALIAAHVYRMMDKIMLGWFNRLNDLGCYEYADKFIRLPLSIITAIGTVLLSKMSNLFIRGERDKIEKVLYFSGTFVIYMSIALSFGIASIAPEFIVVFLGEEYKGTVVLLELLSITIPMIGWNNFIRTQIIIPQGLDKIYTMAVFGGAIVNIFFNLLLIPKYNALGAAIATIIAYLTILIIQTAKVRKTIMIYTYFRTSIFPMLIGAGMLFINRVIGCCIGVSILTVVVQVTIGSFFYMMMSYEYFKRLKKIDLIEIIKR